MLFPYQKLNEIVVMAQYAELWNTNQIFSIRLNPALRRFFAWFRRQICLRPLCVTISFLVFNWIGWFGTHWRLIWDALVFSCVPVVLNVSRGPVPVLSIVPLICPEYTSDCLLYWIWSMHWSHVVQQTSAWKNPRYQDIDVVRCWWRRAARFFRSPFPWHWSPSGRQLPSSQKPVPRSSLSGSTTDKAATPISPIPATKLWPPSAKLMPIPILV